jgi:hypothetical protein
MFISFSPAYETDSVQNTFSNSKHPQFSTLNASYDHLIQLCSSDQYYVKTGGSKDSQCSLADPCYSFNVLLNQVSDKTFKIFIVGYTFYDRDVNMFKDIGVTITTIDEDFEEGRRAILFYDLEGPVAPYFTVSLGELSFLWLIVDFSSRSKGPFVSVTGYFIIFYLLKNYTFCIYFIAQV